MELLRLDKLLSVQLNISRSEVKKLIWSGVVTVNGNKVNKYDIKINPQTDSVCISGQAVEYSKNIYIMLNKPSGILSASNDKSRKTVVDLVDDKFKKRNLFPVGRLDKDTTGLILITDDGEYAHKIISPKNKTRKVYLAELDATPTDEVIIAFRQGVVLADGEKCRPAELEVISSNTARVTLFDGKYHQVKRMFGVFGIGVDKLHRESVGELTLPIGLNVGEYIILTKNEAYKAL